MVQKSALIIGGADFIGTHLSRHLLSSGKFRGITSIDIKPPETHTEGVVYASHDIRMPIPSHLDSSHDVVFNLAAIHRTPGHQDYEYFDTNVAGAVNCVEYCERNKVDTVLFTSSIAVYGPSEDQIDETSALCANTSYGKSKVLAEEIHKNWQKRGTGRKLRIVRPAVVFGEGENGTFTLCPRERTHSG